MKVEWVPAGSLLELQRRAVEVRPDVVYQEIGVRSFGKGLFIKDALMGAELGGKRVFYVKAGDFIVSNVFAWEGAVGVAAPDHDGLIGSHRFMTWTPRSDVSVDYLRHYFGSEAGVESLASASPGSAGRNRTLSIKNFEQVLVPVPSRPDQDRIVAHLGRHTRPGRDDSTLDALVAGFTARGIEESPLVPFGSLLQLQREPVELVDGERYRRIGIYSWGKGMLRRESASANEMGSMRYFTFPIPSLVFSNIQAWEGAVALASPEDGGHVCSSRFYPYVPREGVDVDLRFLLEFFRSDQGIALMRRASPGTQVRNKLLSRSALEMAVVPFPGRTIQDRIVTRRQMVDKVTDVIKRADELADAILPAARNEIFNAMR